MPRTVTSDRFAVGSRIGDYLVEREVAYELSAIVYLVTHVVLPRQALVKVTHPGSRIAAVQLLRETCLLEALSHIGIPRVYECGVLADRRPWCAIELMSGVAFEQVIGERRLAPPDLAIVLRDVADILGHAHERGVVHRRLTAQAVICTVGRRSGFAICDWSDACTLDTVAGDVDPRDDIHALGALAYRALTGARPGTSASAAAHRRTLPAELTALTDLTELTELTELIDEMLAEPIARPAANEVYDRARGLCLRLDRAPEAHDRDYFLGYRPIEQL